MEYILGIMSAQSTQAIGIAGFAAYVLSYLMLTLRWISADSTVYFALNLAAARLVLVSLAHSFNLASALIQLLWICISIVGITMRLTRRGTAA